ncbi:MAG TPA: GNAT family N-acetyltransferase [Labilithrix sp.]|jgi:GNAT superfamily N-acetyltransferase
MKVEVAGPEHFEALARLFEACSSSCYCAYWHFEGTKNEWLDRCAHRPGENADELRARLAEGRAGLVAVEPVRAADGRNEGEGERVIGWMKLVPRARLPKLRRLPVYRALDLGPEDTTLSVGCFLVDPASRRRGVARAMLAAAERFAREWGARAIEGYPRRSAEPLHDEEAWQGPERLFVELGWAPVHDVAPYPVYRKGVG